MKGIASSFLSAGIALAISTSIAFAASPSAISDISGLAIWLDATDISGDGSPTADGASISAWVDKAGGITFQQGNASLQPIMVASAMNGMPAVRFVRPDPNSAQYLSGGGGGDSIVSSTFDNENTVFVVTRANAGCGDSGSQDPQYVFARIGCHSGLGFGGYPDAKQYYSCRWAAGNAANLENRVDGYTQGDTIVYTRIIDGSTSSGSATITLAVNNEVVSSASQNMSLQSQGGDLHLGCAFTSGGYTGGFTGDIAEMLVYDHVLTQAEQNRVWAYLGSRWGLVGFVPANPVTGSLEWLSSGTFAIQEFPLLDNGSEYQFSNSGDAPVANDWQAFTPGNPPTSATLAPPPPPQDGEWTIYLWTRDGGGATKCLPATIGYSTEAPVASARPLTVSIDAVNGTAITSAMIDAGSTAGASGLFGMGVSPSVIYAPGNVTLAVTNNAGLVDTATVAVSSGSWDDAYVSPEGSDSTGTGFADAPWRTVSHALSALGKSSDATLHIGAGTYDAAAGETFPLQPGNVAIVGEGEAPSDVVIVAPASARAALYYNGSDYDVERIYINNVTLSGGACALGIASCANCDGFGISNCVFSAAAQHGAEVADTEGVAFTDCVFTGNGGHGLYFHGAPSTRLLRCAFVGNTLSGIRGGAGGWGADPGGGCAGTTGSFCYFANNGVNGIHIGVDGAYWVFDHCTILNNGLHGYGPTGEYDGSGIYNSGMLSDSIVAFNKGCGLAMNWAGLTTTNTIFYQNVGGKFGGNAANAVNATGVIESDPALYPYAGRIDGALYCDSPAIGKASDGLNLGCYQGAGMQYPDPVIYYVRPDGNDSHDGLSNDPSGAFASLAPFANIKLMLGDSIRVAAGTYDTAFALSGISASAARPMRVIGEDGAIFECASSVAHSISGSDCVSVEGIAFVGGAGFTVSGSTGCTFTNCVFTGSAGQGVEVANSPSTSFTDCAISNNVANGIYFHGSASLRLLRDIFVANGQSGIIGGRGGWGTQTHGDVDTCAGTSGSFCYFARNGGNAIQMNVDNVSWVFDHCTIVGNGGFGFGAAPGATIGTWGTIADSVVAFNGGAGMSQSHGSSTATGTLFYQNVGGTSAAHGDYRGNIIGCLEDTDPLLCPYTARVDGAVFKGSPVFGAASDGLNLGCYQGEGEEEVVNFHTYYVRPDGDDVNDGLANTSVGAFATIARGARALANPGDALFIAAGSYTGTVSIANVAGSGRYHVSIIAEPGTSLTAFADPEAEVPATAAFAVSGCSNFDLSGLTVVDGLGMSFTDCSGFTLSNITVEAATGNGLTLSGCATLTVADSVFRGNGGHGTELLGTASATFLRCAFARNAMCGIGIGNRAGTSNVNMSYCYFGFNGLIGFGYALAGFGNSIADHCTFVKNGLIGYGDYDATGHNPQYPIITNSIFAANCSGGIVANMGIIRSPMTMFWSNGGFDLAVTASAGDISKLENDSHIFGVDPLLCDWYEREDGALYAGSPAIGAADDGSNLGCYQGAGEEFPVAKTYYVSPEGSDANDGLSAATAFATLSNACDRALGPGDTIRVAAGAYAEPTVLSGALGLAASPVRIIAESGTTLSATMRIVDSACVEISGLAFTGVVGGVGLSIEDSVQVAVRGCSATGNLGGVRTDAKSSNISFADCEFSSNTHDGIAVTASPDVFLERCRLAGNGRDGIYSEMYPPLNAWIVYGEKGALLRQCLLDDNGRYGSYSDSVVVGHNDTRAGDIRLESCVVCCNGTDSESAGNGGVFSSFNRHPYGNASVNTIIAFNKGAGIRVRGDPQNENYRAANSFDCVYGNTVGNLLNGYNDDCYEVTPGEGTILVDPLLRDPVNGIYRISAASPCVNAGTNQEWMATATDLNGHNPRVVDDRVDIGAYEIFLQGTILLIR